MPVKTWTNTDMRHHDIVLKMILYNDLFVTFRDKAEECETEDDPIGFSVYVDVCGIIMDKLKSVGEEADALKAELEEELKSLI